MKLIIDREVAVLEPTEYVSQWIEETYTLKNPEYATLKRLGKWTGGVPRHLYLYEKRGTHYILPYGCLPTLTKNFKFDVIDFRHHQAHPINYHQKDMGLRPYQKEAWLKMMLNDVGILQAPAGSGKTQIGLQLVFSLKRRALWLTHTKDLVDQTYERALQFVDPSLVSKTTEGRVDISEGLTVATVQTMSALDLAKYRDVWDVIIVDECHRCSGTPAKMRMFTKVLSNLDAPNKYGLSATVHRADGLIDTTMAYLGQIIHEIPREAVEEYVMPVTIKKQYTGIPLGEECLDTDGTIVFQKVIAYLCENETRNTQIIHDLLNCSEQYNLVLSQRVGHLTTLAKGLPKDDTAIVTGKTPKAKREQALQDARDGKIHYLLSTYQLAKEGLDIPRLENVFLVTPQKDYAIVTQSIGRIARLYEGKSKATAYDYVDRFGYAEKCWKARMRTYKKGGCTFE